MNDRVHAGSLVTLHYRLRTLDGTELVSTFAQRPATLQLGNGAKNCRLPGTSSRRKPTAK